MTRTTEQRNEDGSRSMLCGAPGCTETTREHKPYCADHLELMPYVREVLERILAHEGDPGPLIARVCAECKQTFYVRAVGVTRLYCGPRCVTHGVYRRRREREASAS